MATAALIISIVSVILNIVILAKFVKGGKDDAKKL